MEGLLEKDDQSVTKRGVGVVGIGPTGSPKPCSFKSLAVTYEASSFLLLAPSYTYAKVETNYAVTTSTITLYLSSLLYPII